MLWFRQDLRLQDHAALAAAVAYGRRVVPVYVLDDHSPGAWRLGGAARWWLHVSLLLLGRALAKRGTPLVLRRGPAVVCLATLAQEAGATEVHAGRPHEFWARRADDAAATALRGVGASLHLHRTAALSGLDGIRSETGGVYGPFAKQMRARPAPPEPLPAPGRIPSPPTPASDALLGACRATVQRRAA